MEKEIQAFPTAYFPSIVYMSFLIQAKEILIDDVELYRRQTYRNRARIATDKGVQLLSVPVHRPHGRRIPLAEVRISYTENWIQDHFRAMEAAYNKSPFFLYLQDDLFAILQQKELGLVDLNTKIVLYFLEKLKISTRFSYLSSREVDRFSHSEMKKESLPLRQDLIFPSYPQVFSDRNVFAQNMSILDLFCNCGNESRNYLESFYELNRAKLKEESSCFLF